MPPRCSLRGIVSLAIAAATSFVFWTRFIDGSEAMERRANRKSEIPEDIILREKYLVPYMKAFESGMDHFDIAENVFKTRYIGRWMREVLPSLPNITFVLVTAKGDLVAPPPDAVDLLKDPRLIRWFTQNLGMSHPKLEPIPIGLKNFQKGVATRPNYIFPFILLMDKDMNEEERPVLVYLNFNISHHPSRSEAVAALKDIGEMDFPSNHRENQQELYFSTIAKSKFVAAPKGVGMDCFRTWEAIAMGAIPIVENSSLNPLHEQGPVLIVDKWDKSLITEEFLLKHDVKVKSRLIITADYWFDKINRARAPFLDK